MSALTLSDAYLCLKFMIITTYYFFCLLHCLPHSNLFAINNVGNWAHLWSLELHVWACTGFVHLVLCPNTTLSASSKLKVTTSDAEPFYKYGAGISTYLFRLFARRGVNNRREYVASSYFTKLCTWKKKKVHGNTDKNGNELLLILWAAMTRQLCY